ncbi:hypothetical protein Tco_0552888 [Tanacetum coccineum]
MTLKFADTHNIVAFLSKPAESDGFEPIVDFLNAYLVKHALTVNPTIYTSCIQQFWANIKAKTINREVQLQALVDGKKVIIIESTIRRDLQLEDAEGVDCLPNAKIFKQLTLMDSKTTAWNEFSSIMASTIICLAINQKFNFSKYIFESMVKNLDNMGKFLMYPRFENVSKTSNDSLLARVNTPQSDEDSLKLKELMELCTNLQNKVIDLEKTKTSQAQEITILKRRVKILEKKEGSRTHGLKILYKVGLSRRVESSGEEGLGEEDASKQERKINDIDADEGIILVDETTVTLAQALATLKSIKPKAKGIIFKEPDESTTTTIPIPSIPIPLKVQDKGKGIMVEPEKPMKKKDQISLDEEKARLFVQFLEERRKHFAAKKAKEKRNKPPTRAQQRSIMCTYLKNMEGWKPKDLKNKSFANIQVILDKAMKRRAGEELEQESSKKQKVEEDKESEELKRCLEIVSDDGDDVAIDATPLSIKSPTIVDYKIYQEGKKSYFQIIKVDGKSHMYLTFGKILKNFDREDLEVLWSIVKARFKKTEPVNYMDNLLLHHLKTMFEHHVEDNSIPFYLLVEKIYPLTNHTLHQMFNDVKLQVDYECEMAFEFRWSKNTFKGGYVTRMKCLEASSMLINEAVELKLLILKRMSS